jgi:molybdate transport system ATP-binding protein
VTGLAGTLRVARGLFRLDLSLAVQSGEVVAVLGPNGAGKSTLLRTVAGLTPLGAGRLTVGERVLDDPAAGTFVAPEHRRLGVVFQDYRLFTHLSVVDNVAFGPRCQGADRHAARRTAVELVELLGLGPVADHKPAALSGGQAQRTALARALAIDPAALLMDEPLAALDAQTRMDVRSTLRDRLAGFTGPTLLVTHDPLDALLLADRLVVLEDGTVRQEGSPTDVAARPVTEYVARLVGVNLYRGRASNGELALTGGGRLAIADSAVTGEVFAMVRPAAITVHPDRPPPSSARNAWPATIERVSLLGDRVRLDTRGQLDAAVDVTAGAVAALGLSQGEQVWLTAKATDVVAYPPPQ